MGILLEAAYSPEVTAAAITGLLTLAGVIISNVASNRKVEHRLETSQAVTDTKIEQLTEEVRKHNSFAERIPIVEIQVRDCERRLDNLEHKG